MAKIILLSSLMTILAVFLAAIYAYSSNAPRPLHSPADTWDTTEIIDPGDPHMVSVSSMPVLHLPIFQDTTQHSGEEDPVVSGDDLSYITQPAASSHLVGDDPHLFMPRLELVGFAEVPSQGYNSSNDSYLSLDSSAPFRPMEVSDSHQSDVESSPPLLGNTQHVCDFEEHGSDESFPCLILEYR